MKKVLIGFFVILFAGFCIYLFGPKAEFEELSYVYPWISDDLKYVESYVNNWEATLPVKEDNEARIIWNNNERFQRTEYSVVYLHGFGASQAEGGDIHRNFARRYGANLYLARIADHGLDQNDVFAELTPKKMLDSALEAVAIAKQLGEKVIIIACSTGSTYAIPIAAGDPDIHAIINLSPNIAIAAPTAKLLTKPWGLQLAKKISGDYHTWEPPEGAAQYWYTKQKIEGLVALQSLIDQTMTVENFNKVKQAFLMLYYYKNEEEQDQTVSVEAMEKMFEQLGTPDDRKRAIALPETGHHVIANRLFSKDANTVEIECYNFAEEILMMEPVEQVEVMELVPQ